MEDIEDKDFYDILARHFMGKVLAVEPGTNTWIEYCSPKAKILADVCAEIVTTRGGSPYLVDTTSATINRDISYLNSEALASYGVDQLHKMREMQFYIRMDDKADEQNLTLTPDRLVAYEIAMQAQVDYRYKKTRWLVTSAPTEEFAAACGMSWPDFKKYYLYVCLPDYGPMKIAAAALEKLMTATKKVRIYHPEEETDLSFTKEGIASVPCTGDYNLPDGEVYTAPNKYSVEGQIKFCLTSYKGQRFEFIRLRFKNGRAFEAEAETPERTEMLNKILDTDEGARYVGEFAVSFNPFNDRIIADILWDEKVGDGIHIAMGGCYDDAFNGNVSAIHWDMVHRGGEIWFDGVLIRKDGMFVLPELLALNPENLKATIPSISPAQALGPRKQASIALENS